MKTPQIYVAPVQYAVMMAERLESLARTLREDSHMPGPEGTEGLCTITLRSDRTRRVMDAAITHWFIGACFVKPSHPHYAERVEAMDRQTRLTADSVRQELADGDIQAAQLVPTSNRWRVDIYAPEWPEGHRTVCVAAIDAEDACEAAKGLLERSEAILEAHEVTGEYFEWVGTIVRGDADRLVVVASRTKREAVERVRALLDPQDDYVSGVRKMTKAESDAWHEQCRSF